MRPGVPLTASVRYPVEGFVNFEPAAPLKRVAQQPADWEGCTELQWSALLGDGSTSSNANPS